MYKAADHTGSAGQALQQKCFALRGGSNGSAASGPDIPSSESITEENTC